MDAQPEQLQLSDKAVVHCDKSLKVCKSAEDEVRMVLT